MDLSRAPVLEALRAFRDRGHTVQTALHRQSRGVDQRVLDVLDYVRSGLSAGMQIPDPVDAELKSVRVVAR